MLPHCIILPCWLGAKLSMRLSDASQDGSRHCLHPRQLAYLQYACINPHVHCWFSVPRAAAPGLQLPAPNRRGSPAPGYHLCWALRLPWTAPPLLYASAPA
jgi:hypothetical protein